MKPSDPRSTLNTLFESTLDSDEIDEIQTAFETVPSKAQTSALNMGLILSDFSIKASAAYFRILPDVLRSINPDELSGWVGMGIKVATKSAASGIRFFKKGPAVFSQIASKPLRTLFIQQGIALAEGDVNLAVEYYSNAPSLLAMQALTNEAFSEWISQGRALGQVDYTLAVEYFRITPTLLPHLPMEQLGTWVAVGRKLAAEKLFPTLLYMRNSPEVFSKISSDPVKKRLLDLTAEVAEQRPALAGQIFTESTAVLPPFRALQLELVLIEKAIRIAQFDGTLATTFFSAGPKILKEMGNIAHRFPEWVDQGIPLLKKGPEAASAYFSLQGKSGLVAIDRLRGGISLSRISRTLKLFAEALSGLRVSIQATTEIKEDRSEAEADLPTTDGETIYLPPHIGHFANDRLNFEWYKVATAYQAGYLEYGSFYPQMNETADLIESLQHRYQRKGGFKSLDSFFSLFPEPRMARQLFELAEGARVEFKLRREYPGLRQAMLRMRESDLEGRPPLTGLTPRGVVMELLTQISLSGKTKEAIPKTLQSIVFEACRILGVVQDPAATVATSMKAATSAYEFIEIDEDPQEAPESPMEAFEQEEGTQIKGKSEQSGELRPSARGAIEPKRVEEAQKAKQAYTDALIEKLKAAGIDLSNEGIATAIALSIERGEVSLEQLKEGAADESLDRLTALFKIEQNKSKGVTEERSFFYDEWNCEEQDYRSSWCHLVEKPISSKTKGDVEAILDEYRGMTQSIISSFQMLRPEGLKRVKGAREGDAFDLDALLSSRVDIKSGRTPSEGIYISRQKKERSVAVAFLVDLSGSTQQQLPNLNKSILQVEKEALVLMAKAVDAIGDNFAIYGFSGKGKDAVDFYVLKEFGEPYSSVIDHRIAEIEPAVQNRDGTAIRHAAFKLATQTAKIKTFILISDGKPLDDDYRGSYATADTKMALREAKMQGIHPYCITVDREGAEYLKGMYGDIAYMVIDKIERLPIQLPQIYKRLTS